MANKMKAVRTIAGNQNMFKDYLINKFWCTKSKWYHKGEGHFNWELYRRILKAKTDEIV